MSQHELFNFTGEQMFYDDGIFRIQLPVELTRRIDGNEESMKFHLVDEPYLIEWTTIIIEKTKIEELGGSFETIEEVMGFFIPDLAKGAPLNLIPMANGFNMASCHCTAEGENRACFLLGEFIDEDTFIGTSLELRVPEDYESFHRTVRIKKWNSSVELTAPEDFQGDFLLPALSHLLKVAIRQAHYSYGEPRINSSPEWLYVPKIGIQFPDELGTMRYRFATDYESTGPGEGVSLRYADDDGRRVDIFIYDTTEELIEPGPASDHVLGEMEASLSELESFYAPSVPELIRADLSSYGRDGLPFMDRRFLVCVGVPEEGQGMSAILLTAHLGAFIKVRFSSLPGENEAENSILKSFMDDLADILI